MSNDDLPPFLDEDPTGAPALRVVPRHPAWDSHPHTDADAPPRDPRLLPLSAQIEADAGMRADGTLTGEVEYTVIRSRCYSSAVTVIEQNRRDVLDGRRLAWNEMTGVVTLNNVPQDDTDVLRIRCLIERRLPGGRPDKNGDAKPLQFSKQDLEDAILHVAKTRPYHPVRDYLRSLKWDRRSRTDDLLGWLRIAKSALSRTLIRKWLISAVARAMDPGCKADTMLVLVGGQGWKKSTFFEAMATREFFCDTEVDIRNKDAYGRIRRTWIYEWPELASLFRPKDIDAVKSFLASRVDTYRPHFGRHDIVSPRNCVVVGTTNRPEFLTDETGNRRFWPLTVQSRADADAIIRARDQLWAEAVVAYEAGGDHAWWLTTAEEALLTEAQKEFVVEDAWDGLVAGFIADRAKKAVLSDEAKAPFQTADALRYVKKDHDKWTSGDESRIGRILSRLGFVKGRDGTGKRVWKPVDDSLRAPGEEG